jgi:hypothetical protein
VVISEPNPRASSAQGSIVNSFAALCEFSASFAVISLLWFPGSIKAETAESAKNSQRAAKVAVLSRPE